MRLNFSKMARTILSSELKYLVNTWANYELKWQRVFIWIREDMLTSVSVWFVWWVFFFFWHSTEHVSTGLCQLLDLLGEWNTSIYVVLEQCSHIYSLSKAKSKTISAWRHTVNHREFFCVVENRKTLS